MSIKVTSLPDAESRPRHVAIGTFDGVHVGHRQVIDRADTVLTFEPHPLRVIHPDATPKLIMPFDIKRDVIEGLRVSELVVIPFDHEFSTIPAEEFCSRIPVETLQAEQVSVGENFRFGAKAKGDPEMLAARTEFEGRVVKGDGRGRTLGFPTANLVPPDDLVSPGHGVYAAFANGHPAAVNVGIRPTFETGRGLLIESFLIDYDGDLYGQNLRVAFVGRLRGEKRFPSVEDLVAQMHNDVADARQILSKYDGRGA